jgi:hypothetical protein
MTSIPKMIMIMTSITKMIMTSIPKMTMTSIPKCQ